LAQIFPTVFAQSEDDSTFWILAAVSIFLVIIVGAAAWQLRLLIAANRRNRKLQSELAAASERAASHRGEKTQILRIAMQEMAEPLRLVAHQVGELSSFSSLDAPARERLEVLRGELSRVQNAIGALEEVHGLDERTRSLRLTDVNVGAVLLEAVANVERRAEAKHVRVSVPPPAHTSIARADPEILRKAMINLLRDAIEVTPPGRTVAVSVYSTADRVLITFGDEGPGVIVADQATLLDQSGNSRPPMETGDLRLNLAMVHNLIKAMDGWLWSQAEPGRGTTHVIELSLAAPQS
jgi:signal transduction histidine kinase